MSTPFTTISNCNASKCIYNYSGKCCTLAINVGGPEPLCDTYFFNGKKGGFEDLTAIVGACKVDTCIHNRFYECMADNVEILSGQDLVECSTFRART